MLVIGSTALIVNGLNWSEPKDIDIIMSLRELDDYLRENKEKVVAHTRTRKNVHNLFVVGSDPIEAEIAKNGNSAENLVKIVLENHLYKKQGEYLYAFPEVVYALKMSHRYLRNSSHFNKTMDDIWSLRQYLKTKEISPVLKYWFKQRTKETYDYSHPSLNQNKSSFFSNDGVNYQYDHDSIHESIKLYDGPAFELIKEDKAEVFCSKERFYNEISEELRLATVLEESYALALERHQIPYVFSPDRFQSFLIALEKICTSISSGWWREYAWENYYQIRSLYDETYVDKFRDALSKGLILPYRS